MQKIITAVLCMLAIFIAVKLVYAFYHLPVFWGFNQFSYLPRGFSTTAFAIGAIAIVWAMTKKNVRRKAAPKNKKKASKMPIPRSLVLSSIVLGAGLLFSTVQIAWPFLGDGSAFLGNMFKFRTHGTMEFTPLEIPPMFVIYSIYYLSELAGKTMSAFFPFAVVGVISGMGFVFTSYRLSKIISAEKWIRWLTFCSLLSAGGSLFFFGYVETYHLQYLFVLVYVYQSICYVENQRTIAAPALGLFFAIVFHLQNVLLIPSFILLYSLRNEPVRKTADRRRLVYRSFIVIAPLLLIIYGYFQWHPIIEPPTEPQNPFIPFASLKGFSYTLLSSQRILDILNENLLLAGVPVFVIFAFVISARRSIRFQDPLLLFLTTNLLFFEAYLIGGNAGFGLARDWDIFASIGIFLTLIMVLIVRGLALTPSQQKKIIVPISVLSFLSIISWVYLNVGTGSASSRYEDIVEIYTPKIEAKWAMMGYENLRKFFVRRDVEGELRVIRKMVYLSPRHTLVQTAETDAMQRLQYLTPGAKEELRRIVDHLGTLNDSLLREEVFYLVRIGPHGSGESVTLGEQFEDGVMILYRKFGMMSLEGALGKTDDFIVKHPSLPYGYELRGFLIYLLTSDTKGSLSYLEKAIAIDPSRSRPHLYHALALAKLSQRKEANVEFRAALALDPLWLGGLTYYASFLADKENNVVTAEDISFASERLKRIIIAQPESSLEVHVEAQRAKASLAARLLQEIEHKSAP